MAIINCFHCNAEVSDRAQKCPHCGVLLTPVPEEPEGGNCVCAECGEVLEAACDVCPKCGCPVEERKEDAAQKVDVSNVSIKVSRDGRKKIVIGVIALIVIVLAGIGIKLGLDANAQRQAEEALESYRSTYSSAVYGMYDGAAAADEACVMIHNIWRNTIYETSDPETDPYTMSGGAFNDDFNTSIEAYFASEDYGNLKSRILDGQSVIKGYMKDLQDHPAECSDSYAEIKDYYDAYNAFIDCAIYPEGNLREYGDSFEDARSDFMTEYESVSLYL